MSRRRSSAWWAMTGNRPTKREALRPARLVGDAWVKTREKHIRAPPPQEKRLICLRVDYEFLFCVVPAPSPYELVFEQIVWDGGRTLELVELSMRGGWRQVAKPLTRWPPIDIFQPGAQGAEFEQDGLVYRVVRQPLPLTLIDDNLALLRTLIVARALL